MEQLSRSGVAVDVLALDGDLAFPQAPPSSPSVTIRTVPSWARSRLIVKLPRFIRYLAGQCAALIDLLRMMAAARALGGEVTFNLVVGFDTFGIIIASAVPRARRQALVYWSLELRFRALIRNPIVRIAMNLERSLLKEADLIVVQDSERARLLATENFITTDRIALIPNSALGLSTAGSSRHLHRLLGLASSEKLILHAGMICDEVMSIEVAKAASALKQKYVFVFHERMQRSSTEPYLQSVQAAGGHRVRLSLNPVPVGELDQIFASAFVGVVTYSDQYGANFSEIASASGKLSYLLRNRIPVVVNSIPSLKRFVQDTRCGIVVDDLAEIPNAIDEIASSYETFRSAAEQAFLKHFDFAGSFEKAFSHLVCLQADGRETHPSEPKRRDATDPSAIDQKFEAAGIVDDDVPPRSLT